MVSIPLIFLVCNQPSYKAAMKKELISQWREKLSSYVATVKSTANQ